MLQKKDD